jgi:hypothetical protein
MVRSSAGHIGSRTGPGGRAAPGGRGGRGFSLVEIMFSLLVIFLLMGMIIVGVRHVWKKAKETGERAAVVALKQGADKFKEQFGILVPLVWDNIPGLNYRVRFPQGPVSPTGTNVAKSPVVYLVSENAAQQAREDSFLRNQPRLANGPDLRFSVYSLPYYLIGALGKDVDGVDGPGFLEVNRDGSFKVPEWMWSGNAGTRPQKLPRKFDSFFDARGGSRTVRYIDPTQWRVELQDGEGEPYRYYRWIRGNNSIAGQPDSIVTLDDLNVPFVVGDPAENPKLRDADYAIVSAGPNDLYGDEDKYPTTSPWYMSLTDMAVKLGIGGSPSDAGFDVKVHEAARQDNVVEVGK